MRQILIFCLINWIFIVETIQGRKLYGEIQYAIIQGYSTEASVGIWIRGWGIDVIYCFLSFALFTISSNSKPTQPSNYPSLCSSSPWIIVPIFLRFTRFFYQVAKNCPKKVMLNWMNLEKRKGKNSNDLQWYMTVLSLLEFSHLNSFGNYLICFLIF